MPPSRYNLNEKEIQWVSPLAADNYSEYRDSEFLVRVGFDHLAPAFRKFWPRNGPCWDALARIEGGCILIEAKSHVPEIYGGSCGASPASKQKIQAALDATKAWLGVSQDIDWMGHLYQSANRYAYLNFLREISCERVFRWRPTNADDEKRVGRRNREGQSRAWPGSRSNVQRSDLPDGVEATARSFSSQTPQSRQSGFS